MIGVHGAVLWASLERRERTHLLNAGNAGLIPGLGRSPGEGNGNPLQYSCLENPMDGGAWRAIVHEVEKESDKTEQLNNNNDNTVLYS